MAIYPGKRSLPSQVILWIQLSLPRFGMSMRKVFVSDELIQEKSRRINVLINQGLSAENQLNWKLSDSWLQKLKQRIGFKCFKSHRESDNVDKNIINMELPVLREKLKEHSLNHISNADELRIFYQMPPSQTIAATSIPRRKKKKERITCLARCNAETEKLPLFIIRKSANPECCRGRSSLSYM